MTTQRLLWGLLITQVPSIAFSIAPIDCNVFVEAPSQVRIAWNADPGKQYLIQTTTNLGQPWQNALTPPDPVVAVSNQLSRSFLIQPVARFFRVLRLDTDGPTVYQVSPLDGSIAVPRQAALQAWLRDETGLNTNSLFFRLGTNAPVALADPRLTYAAGILTYAPATNEFLGALGDTVTASLSAADTLGNQTTNFAWSFRLALPSLLSSNIVFIRGTNGGHALKDLDSLTLLSTNGDSFTYGYIGASSGLTNGMQLVNTNLTGGYTRTVVSFTDYPSSNIVVVLTRPTKLAELLQQASLSSGSLIELSSSGGGPAVFDRTHPRTKDGGSVGFPLAYTVNLQGVLYQDANLVVELLPGSVLNLDAELDIAANFGGFKLQGFESKLRGNADFKLEAHAGAQAALDRADTKALIQPVRKFYGTFIGTVPVWVEIVFEVNAGYTLHLEGSADYTNGVQGTKAVLVGRRWDMANGWSTIWQSPPLQLSFSEPRWQVQGSGNLHVYLQPKVTAYVYSAAGVWGDLQPYADLEGRVQLSPYQFDLGLYGGLTSTIGLDLRVWDDSWGELPNQTFDLIPRTLLWQTSSSSSAPQVTGQPQPQAVPTGGTASFSVQASGAAPLSFRWQKNGLNLTDDWRISGSRGSALRIVNAQGADAGDYRVSVSNPYGSTVSQSASLSVYSGTAPTGMALIPAGNFTMGNCMDANEGRSDELPLHTVYISAFYMDKYEVTKSLWDTVYQWAVTHGYSFEYGAQGKANNHPAHSTTWYDTVKWCNARSEKEGRTPAYYTSAAQTTVYRSGRIDVDNAWVKWNTGYRLATEAEWEKAARGGASGHRFPWADSDNISHSRANYYSSSSYSYDVSPTRGFHPTFNNGVDPFTSPVGYFAPNGYGLYDMTGNVGEWCWDRYGSYTSDTQSDPHGSSSGSLLVFRGGSWESSAFLCRTAFRFVIFDPSIRYNEIGFRSVLPPGQ